jgi:hypothetical protein
VEHIRGIKHRLHALLLSRQVAEHLALDGVGILDLMTRCRDWFPRHGLEPPTLYVPPAWALGTISRAALRDAAAFRQLETFAGVLDIASGVKHASPVLGYEADAPVRVPVLRLWNAIGRRRAAKGQIGAGAVRIGIHPSDIDYPLRDELIADLKRFDRYVDYSAVSARTPDFQADAPHLGTNDQTPT